MAEKMAVLGSNRNDFPYVTGNLYSRLDLGSHSRPLSVVRESDL